MKKKILFLIYAILVFVILAGCELETTPNYNGKEYRISYIYDGEVLNLEPSKYVYGEEVKLPTLEVKGFVGWYLDKAFNGEDVKTISKDEHSNKIFYAKVDYKIDPENGKRLNDVRNEINNGEGITRGMPSIGDVKVLVIPLEFTDYKSDSDTKEVLEKALFGTEADTGWESLSSYYKKTSYGKLNITGKVTDVYNTGKKTSYLDKDEENEKLYSIFHDALAYFDDQIDYSEYDSDSDGYIDAIYFIYTSPIDYDDSDSVWWAFTDEYVTEDYDYFDEVEADFYFFAGYDFFFEEIEGRKDVKYNTETLIHETGHLLGLDDYYDYDDTDKVNKGGLGGGDMMDANVGDHNAYSKTILGWITPRIIETSRYDETEEVTLKAFVSSGEAIIIIKEYEDTYYSEYYILSLYSPIGLNEMEAGNYGLFSIPGITLYHVSSELSTDKVESIWDMTKYNNAAAKTKLIKLIEADGKGDIDREKDSTNSDLFVTGLKIENLKWNDGSSVGISINVIKTDTEEAKLVINKN